MPSANIARQSAELRSAPDSHKPAANYAADRARVSGMITFEILDEHIKGVPTGPILFHYTTQEGLLGIINTKSLWITSVRHLSDSTEFAYTVELVREKLNRKLRAEHGPFNDYYGSILGKLDVLKDMTLFVGSFSEQGDLLSQWRAYTSNGIGFSIGFEYDYLKRLAEKQQLRIIRCVYEESKHADIVEKLINLGTINVKDGESQAGEVVFFTGLYQVAPALKHPSFSEEREWRIVSNVAWPNTAPPRFRPGKSMLIPYREFNLAAESQRMWVSKIFVGPTPHMPAAVSSLLYLLTTSENVERQSWTIVPSCVPYRSW